MSLAAALDSAQLYVAVGQDVNVARPLFTGDVFDNVDIPGLGETAAVLIGHPCSIRGHGGALNEATPVAAVEPHEPVGTDRWKAGYYNRFPLPDLPLEGSYHVARLDRFGLAATDDLRASSRVACLSHPGINLLQQRLVFHQTRLEVPTGLFQEAFDHTYEEADLLEDWATDLDGIDPNPVASFEQWIRDGEPSRQKRLESPQQRAPVRRELQAEIKARRLASTGLG